MALLGHDSLSESPLSALPEASALVAPPAFSAVLLARQGRRPDLQVYIEGLPDVLCTAAPPDPKSPGYALSFDGVNDYAATASVTDLFPDGDFTIVIWFRPSTVAAGYRSLFSWADNPKTTGWDLVINGNLPTLITRAAEQYPPSSLMTVAADKWQCLIVSLGGTYGCESRWFLATLNSDGTFSYQRANVSSVAGPAVGATRAQRNSDSAGLSAAIEFGRRRDGSRWFSGRIGYTALYDRAFTASEMERVFYRVIDEKWGPLWEDLRAQWNFLEGTGTKVRNSATYQSGTGAAYHITTISGASWDTAAGTGVPWTITYREVMSAISAVGQDLEARATRTTIAGLSFTALDSAEWLTAYLKRSSQAVRRKSAWVFAGFDEITEEEYQLVLQGAVESISPLRGRGYDVKIGDAIRLPKTSITLGATTLRSAITDVATTIPVTSLFNFKGRTTVKALASVPIAGYVRIDDEIIYYESTNTGPNLLLCVRARFGTTAAAHDSGAAVKEIWAELSIHPIDMLLCMLISSTGGLTTHATYDAFTRYTDTLGDYFDGRGAGVALADIDVDAIVALAAARWSSYAGDFLVMDAIDDLKDWLEENILRPLGAFFATTAEGKLTLGTWHAPAEASAATLEQGDQAGPEAAVDFAKLVNSIQARYDLAPLTGEYGGVTAYEEIDSGRDHGAAPTLRLDSPWIRTAGIQSGTPFGTTPATILDAGKTVLFERFKDPQAIVTVTVGLAWWDIEVGAGVIYQHEEIPDFVQGFRGVQGELFQVVGRTLDLKRARVVLKLMRVPA